MMKNKVFVIDLDETLIQGQSQKYLIDYLREIKTISFFRYFNIIAGFLLYKLSLYKNAAQLLEYSLKNFKGEKEENIYKYVNDFFEMRLRKYYYKYTKEIIILIQDSGNRIIVLSAVIDPLVKKICEDLNIKEYVSTRLDFNSEGIFTGNIIDKQNYGSNKLENIKRYLDNHNVDEKDVVIMTDHISDIALIKYFKNAIVANPNRQMKKWSRQNNYPIIYLDNNESLQYIKHYIES